ncbi:MAG: tetratricopeptide repeat protein, partial [Bacteroidota bacterium]
MNRILLSLLIIISAPLFAQQDPLEPIRKKVTAGDHAGAKADLGKFLEGNPRSKAALALRGKARLNLADYYGAIADITLALEIDSTLSDAYNDRGLAKMNLNDDDNAIVDFTKAIKFNPKFADA